MPEPGHPQHDFRPPVDARTNGLGIAGFVISLVGLCSGGMLSPIGLILSAVAVAWPPRGFAIAGIVLGAIGSCGIILAILVIPAALAAVFAAAGLGALAMAMVSVVGGPELHAQIEMGLITNQVESHRDKHAGTLPATLGELDPGYRGMHLDPWSRAYRYIVSDDGKTFTISSDGPDGQAGTADDIQFKPSGSSTGP